MVDTEKNIRAFLAIEPTEVIQTRTGVFMTGQGKNEQMYSQ